MDIIGLIMGSPIIGILFDLMKNRTSYIKRGVAWLTNKQYKIQLLGMKKYSFQELKVSKIKNELFNKYSKINIISEKQNSIIVLIENMQAPYEILISNDECEDDEDTNMNIKIVLIGSVEFRYRESNDYNKFFIVLDNLFDMIEQIMNQKPVYSFFTLQADIKNDFQGKPFISENIQDECEDTKLNIDRSSSYIKINSKSKDNLYYCLKKNIYKVI